MTAEIIDGRKIAAEIQTELKQRIGALNIKGVTPKLVTVLVGEDPASLSYLRGITRTCGEVGVITEPVKLPETITQQALIEKIGELNRDVKVHGILLFLPLPKHLNALEAKSAISPQKEWTGQIRSVPGNYCLAKRPFSPRLPMVSRNYWYVAGIVLRENTWSSSGVVILSVNL